MTSGGYLTLQSAITNTGIIEAVGGGHVTADGSIENAGTMEAVGDGSLLTIQGNIDNKAGSIFETVGTGSQIDLNGATLSGTVVTSWGTFMRFGVLHQHVRWNEQDVH